MKSLSKIPAIFAATALLVMAGGGCFLTDSTSGEDDINWVADTSEPSDSMAVFEDIVVLGDTWEGADSALADATEPDWDSTVADASVSDEGNISGSDTIVGSDNAYEDPGYLADVTTELPATDIPGIRVECPNGDDDCPEGFLCADDKMGGRLCKPVGECSMDGVTSIEDLIKEFALINTSAPVFIKVSARVEMAKPTCSLLNCDADKPCCNECFASLLIADAPLPIVLSGTEDQPVKCKGNECNIDQNCAPLKPGTEYVIWGTARMFTDGPQIRVEGWCAVSDIAPN